VSSETALVINAPTVYISSRETQGLVLQKALVNVLGCVYESAGEYLIVPPRQRIKPVAALLLYAYFTASLYVPALEVRYY
jgi:hypothetical protein